ncbi:MAG: hypothetical protein KDA58_11270, partial [Planctomycetaceae bacterium]|nr:hypothetical protein [Planctomycetaceae bacterium]
MLRPLLCSVFLLLGGQFCLAQNDRGFEQKVEAYGTIEEVVRQPDLWIMEVQLKPMRMVYLDVRNPQTG